MVLNEGKGNLNGSGKMRCEMGVRGDEGFLRDFGVDEVF